MATYLEIQKQIESLQKEAEALKEGERKGVIERMREAIAVYDITPRELGFGLEGGRKTAGKKSARSSSLNKKRPTQKGERAAAYSDSSGNTWGGRGPRPKWLREALAGGARLEDFAK